MGCSQKVPLAQGAQVVLQLAESEGVIVLVPLVTLVQSSASELLSASFARESGF